MLKDVPSELPLDDSISSLEKTATTEDRLMEIALKAGAEDIQTSEEGYEVTTLHEFELVKKDLKENKTLWAAADLAMIPSQTVTVSIEATEEVQKVIDALEANDDVQNVYSNAAFE